MLSKEARYALFGPLVNIAILVFYTALFLFMGTHIMNQRKE